MREVRDAIAHVLDSTSVEEACHKAHDAEAEEGRRDVIQHLTYLIGSIAVGSPRITMLCTSRAINSLCSMLG